MAITREDPRRIHLGGPVTIVNDAERAVASEAITPGHLVEQNAGKYRKNASAAAAASPSFALDFPEYNKGYADDYAADDNIQVGVGAPGSTFWAWLASGETVVAGNQLESNGDGTFVILAAGVPLVTALEDVNTTGGAARIRVEVM